MMCVALPSGRHFHADCHWLAVVSANFLLAERVYTALFHMT